MLLVFAGIFVVVMSLGSVGAISAEVGMLSGMMAGCGIGVSALFCVVGQIVTIPSRKRHFEHG